MRLGGPFARLLSVHPLGGCAMGRSARGGRRRLLRPGVRLRAPVRVRRLDPARPGGRQPEHDHRRPGRADRGGGCWHELRCEWSESMSGRVSFDTSGLQPGLVAGHALRLPSRPARRRRRALLHRRRARGDVQRLDRLRRPGRAHGDHRGDLQPARRRGRPAPARDALPPVRPRSRRAPGDARGRQERRGRLVPTTPGSTRPRCSRASTPGWVARDEEDGATPLATGILHVSAGGFLALMRSMRGSLRDKLRYGAFFTRSLLQVYVGRAHGHRLDRLPRPAPGLRALAGLRARAVARLPRAPGPAPAHPGRAHRGRARPHRPPHPRRAPSPREGPVLLQHGTGVRANLFYGSPMPRSIVDVARRGGLRRLAGQLARLDRPARVRLHARRGGALRPPGADRRRAARDRGADAQGGRPLPGLDVLRPGLRRRPGARGDRRGLQRRVLPRRRPAAVQAADAGADAAAARSATPASTRSGRSARRRCAPGCWPPGRAPCAASAASPCARWPTTPTASAATSCGTTRTSTRPRTAGSRASSAGCRPPSSARCRAAPRPGTWSRPRASTSCPTTSWPRRRATGRAGRSWPARPTAASWPAARSARSRGWTPWSPGATRSSSFPATPTSTSSSAATPSATCSATSVDALLRGTSNPRGS